MSPSDSPHRWGAAFLTVLGLVSVATADPSSQGFPLPPPTPACLPPAASPCPTCPATAERGPSPPPKIVINVPPPEVVYQDVGPSCRPPFLHPRWCLFNRRPCALCSTAPAAVQTQAVMLAPAQTFTTGSALAAFNTGGLSFGTANVGLTGLTLANVSPGLGLAQVNPGLAVAQVNPGLVAQVGVPPAQSPAISGLQAIHQAEMYAASVAAVRAQQDAELRSMVAALDRARGSMASMTAQSGGCPDLTSDGSRAVVAATTTNTKQITVLTQQMDQLQVRLDAVQKQVGALTKTQEAVIDRLPPLPAIPAASK